MQFAVIKNDDTSLVPWIQMVLDGFDITWDEIFYEHYKQAVEANLNSWLYYGYQEIDKNGFTRQILCVFKVACVSEAMPFYLTSFVVQSELRNLGNGKRWFNEFITIEAGKTIISEGLFLDCDHELFESFWSKLGFKVMGNISDKLFLCKFVGISDES